MSETKLPEVPERLFIGWHTSVLDGYGHAVTDDAFGCGVRKRLGEVEAVYGLVICLAPAVAPCGRPCPHCVAFVQAHATAPPAVPSTGWLLRRLGWPRWVMGRQALKASA